MINSESLAEQFGPSDTPGAVWIIPALLGFWAATVAVRWVLGRLARRRVVKRPGYAPWWRW